MAIILGIDPGSRVTGYGVIRQVGRQLSYLGNKFESEVYNSVQR